MISFTVDSRFIQDLEDDFMVNEDLTLYEFIGKDPIKAFYLGLYLTKWFEHIDRKQRYLYSKQARHNNDSLEKYLPQIQFWSNKFPKQEEFEMVDLAEYVINNIFWDEKTKDEDIVKMAFFFGDIIHNQQNKEEKSNE